MKTGNWARSTVINGEAGLRLIVPMFHGDQLLGFVGLRKPNVPFELTFEENLRIARLCARHGTRLVFPSASEVYGMCDDSEFVEDRSNAVLGPIHKQRWIYACSKQLLDRVIWAYGMDGQLDFTLIRPFNWIGPKLDDPQVAKEGSSRVVTQFISNLVNAEPIRLVDGGGQKRCFTHIDDGIDCLLRIIENRDGVARGEIFNIGNPHNECSMRELAEKLVRVYLAHPARRPDASPEILEVSSEEHYGEDYQDILVRKPSVAKAGRLLGWEPRIGLDCALELTLDDYLEPRGAVPARLHAVRAACAVGAGR